MHFTLDQMAALAPKADRLKLAEALMILDGIYPNYNVVHEADIAAFTALLIIDSNQFRKGREDLDLNIMQMQKPQFIKQQRTLNRPFLSIEHAKEFIHNPVKLGDFLYDKKFGNEVGEGYEYRGAFYNRLYGKDAILEHKEFTIEYEIDHPLPLAPCRDLPLDQFCLHLLPNILSVVRKWRKHDLSKHARAGKIETLINCYCDYPDQVRKATSLIEDVVEMHVDYRKSISSSNV